MPIPPDGVPCKHPGCLSHISHPCEGCGRIGGRRPETPTDIRNQPSIEITTEMSMEEAKRRYPDFNPNFSEAQRRVIETPGPMVLASNSSGSGWVKERFVSPAVSHHDKPELMLGEVFRIAVEVHGNQRDKAGRPYMEHVMRVAMAMGDDYEIAAALLHDAIEDSTHGRMSLAMKIRVLCGVRVQEAIVLLTRELGECYMDYVRRLSANPLARKVKLADWQDNMNEQRLRLLPPADAERLRKKYREAWDFLMGLQ